MIAQDNKSSTLVRIPISHHDILQGDLCIPNTPVGIIVFVHGSGSNRHSPRNRHVAGVLQNHHIGTLLIDLLTARENEEDARTKKLRFDIDLLAKRLIVITDWLRKHSETKDFGLGYFSTSTGTAAALIAAVQLKGTVKAIVSRGGRPDLAGATTLKKISTPILLLVGSDDSPALLGMHHKILKNLEAVDKDDKILIIVPKVGHLFDEPWALEEVALHSSTWFRRYLQLDDLSKSGKLSLKR